MSALYDWLATKPAANEVGYFQDGNMLGAFRGDFRDLAVSPAGFGMTRTEALRNLECEELKPQPKPSNMTDEEFRHYLERYWDRPRSVEA